VPKGFFNNLLDRYAFRMKRKKVGKYVFRVNP